LYIRREQWAGNGGNLKKFALRTVGRRIPMNSERNNSIVSTPNKDSETTATVTTEEKRDKDQWIDDLYRDVGGEG
jgi:hypothetical protein